MLRRVFALICALAIIHVGLFHRFLHLEHTNLRSSHQLIVAASGADESDTSVQSSLEMHCHCGSMFAVLDQVNDDDLHAANEYLIMILAEPRPLLLASQTPPPIRSI
ncbi:hypothetical protein [Afipia felis]